MLRGVRADQKEYIPPALRAHAHTVAAEEALERNDLLGARKENLLASEQFIAATDCTSDPKTIEALKLLAESHASKAHELQALYIRPKAMASYKSEVLSEEVTSTGGGADLKPPPPPTSGLTISNTRNESTSNSMLTRNSNVDKEENSTEELLEQAEIDMNELWGRLRTLGLTPTPGYTKEAILSSSRHLSSVLGDSFCLLPTKGRGNGGIQAPKIDGAATIRAAAASRFRNQRTRLMEKSSPATTPRDIQTTRDIQLLAIADEKQASDKNDEEEPSLDDKSTSSTSSDKLLDMKEGSLDSSVAVDIQAELEKLKSANAHQRFEIMRLLQTVKTLSSENANLIKECEGQDKLARENQTLREAMTEFKDQYQKKFATLKGALEEWRRQKGNASTPTTNASSYEKQLEEVNCRLLSEVESSKKKDVLIQRYEKWYKTLKAGAQAKQKRKNESGITGGGREPSKVEGDTTSYTEPKPRMVIASSRPPAHPGPRRF